MINYYKILGVPDFASLEEITNAFHKLSQKFHPDLNDGDEFFVTKFAEINEAYEYLIIDYNRGILDQFLKDKMNKGFVEEKSSKSNFINIKTILVIVFLAIIGGTLYYMNNINRFNSEEKKSNLTKQQFLGLKDKDGRISNYENNGVKVGDSRESIIDRYGFPDKSESHRAGEIWYYGMHEIYFVNGKVKQVGNIERGIDLGIDLE